MALPYEVEFGSFLVYSPRGIEKTSKTSKGICIAIKDDGFLTAGGVSQRAIPFLVKALRARLPGSSIENLFADSPVLVPAPRSAPTKEGSLNPTHKICEEMAANGFGSETRFLLERITAVPKAATSAPKDRPTVQMHYDSMRVNPELAAPRSIVVVDDVVTRGTMFLAAVGRLQDFYPQARIRAFGMVRTMSGVEVTQLIDICRGSIYRHNDWGTRSP